MDSIKINQFKITLKKIGINEYMVKNSIIGFDRKKYKNDPKVVVFHSVPVPVSIKDKNKNIIGKGALLIHLYQTPCSPCILCAVCKKFFSLPDFFYHMNSDEISGKQKNKINVDTLTIEPYLFKNQTNNPINQMKIWKEFKIKTKMFNQH